MNIWRVKSKTGKTVHLTSDRVKTFCGRTIRDNWVFLYLLKNKTEALENVENLCSKCNSTNLQEWEKEMEYDEKSESIEGIRDNSESRTTNDKPAKPVKVKGLGTW